MKTLITGGAGFIGSHIVDLLIKNGYEVIVLDSLTTGTEENINDESKFYKGNIYSPALENVFKKERPNFIIHQAAQISVRESTADPVSDANINIIGSLNLLECCRRYGAKKVIYASSAGVYGEPEYLPVDEKHPINPLSPYGASKHAVEHYLYLYWKNFGLDYTVLRYSNVYGPRQDPSGEAGVVSIFIERMLRNKRATIFGDGNQTRDFVFVKDVAMANLLALETESRNKVFNISSGVETSVNELFGKLKSILRFDKAPVHSDPIPGEVRRIYLGSSLAKKELSWEPKTSLEDGLKEIIGWLKILP